ncbi:MAG: hypothetical protein GXP10_07310 [Gammaproteobacteria bacterium]|nr:hypothetical protein [Gammaproteobacteria bacterium]
MKISLHTNVKSDTNLTPAHQNGALVKPSATRQGVTNAPFFLAVFFASLLLIALPISSTLAASGTPQVLYTDVVSGPNSGGENNNGAYLSIFGINLGDPSGLGSNTKVYIGSREVAEYKYMGSSYGRNDVQQISVQVGAVSSGAVRVEVGGVSSNSDNTFTVQPGKIWYVSLNGNDATGEIGNINKPFRRVQTPDRIGVWHDVSPGDFIVLRGGDWKDEGANDRFLRTTGNSGSAPDGTLGSGPISIVGYPGENVHIFPQRAGGIHNRGNANEAHWIVIAGLRISGGDGSNVEGPINLQWGSNDWRVINNELFDWFTLETDATSRSARSGGIAGNGNRVKIFGNHIHDIWGDGQRNHGIYFDNDGDPTSVEDIEVAYNYIHDIKGGNGIQSYGSLSKYIRGYRVHHNLVLNVAKHGINASNKTDDAYFYNNIVCNAGGSEFRINSINPSNFRVFNNVFCELRSGSHNNIIANTWTLTSANLIIANNIVYYGQDTNDTYVGSGVSSGWGTARFTNNLYYGLNAGAPSIDENPIGGGDSNDPLFVDPSNFDFRLLAGSVAIDASSTNIPNVLNDDYFLNSRSQGSADVGAYEFPANPGSVPPMVTNRSPLSGANEVAVDSNVSFRISDAEEGVDINSLVVRIDGQVIYNGAQAGSYPNTTVTGSASAYTVTYNPPQNFAFTKQVAVSIDAKDLSGSGNAMATEGYTFQTYAYTAPQISTTVLADTLQGESYNATLSGVGTETPLSWSVSSGQLPAGLSLNASSGLISGTATTMGLHAFAITLTDAAGTTTSKDLSIEVGAPSAITTAIDFGDTWRYFKGTSNPGTNWAAAAFDDSAWLSGPSGFGYGDNDDATVLNDMQDGYLSVYLRKTFSVTDASSVAGMALNIHFDDGFVAYLNGVEIARGNMPVGAVDNNTPANGNNEASATPEAFNLDASISSLVNGSNVLAVEVHNRMLNSSDLSANPQLKIESGQGGGSSTPPGDTTTPPPPPPTPAPMPTLSLSADPSNVAFNSITVLSWTATDASNCRASGDWSGNRTAGASSETVGPLTQDATFTLSCSGDGGNVNKTVTVTVDAQPSANDSDGDGLTDSWEIEQFGDLSLDGSADSDSDGLTDREEFTLGSNPNNSDSDGDGDSDGDEVAYGSDPVNGNDTVAQHRPARPGGLSATSEVRNNHNFWVFTFSGEFTGPDNQALAGSLWQISTSQSFDTLILERDIDSRGNLIVPLGLLKPGTSYWARTRHYNSNELMSEWSAAVNFSLSGSNNDANDDGVDDRYEINEVVDTDNNGADDDLEGMCNLRDAERASAIGFRTSAGLINCVSSFSRGDTPASSDLDLPFGLFSFYITGLPVDANNPAEVQVDVYFPEVLPENSSWHKYDEANGTITPFNGNVSYNGQKATITLVDGSADDADGVVNGIIVDPSGLSGNAGNSGSGDSSSNTGSSTNGSSGGGGGGPVNPLLLISLTLIAATRVWRSNLS